MKEQSSLAEKWENATLANNFIFYKVMHSHPEACKKLVEMLLNIKIGRIKMAAENTIEIDHEAKGIRLDVYLKDSQRVIDVEMQVKDTHFLPERSRYYQSTMDLDNLPLGGKYSSMKDSHVIFICLKDIFNHGLPVYTFQNICQENREIFLNDRTWKHFFIAETCAKMLENKDLRAIFNLIISNSASTNFTDKLKEYIEDAKHNTQWRQQFMIWENNLAEAKYQAMLEGRAEGLAEGRAEGLKEGREEASFTSALTFIKDFNLDPQTVAQKLNIPLDKILDALQSELISASK